VIPDNLYKDFVDLMPIPTVDVIIFDQDGKTLLAKRSKKPAKGQLYTVGGRVLKNETRVEAAVRILKNELGVSVEPEALKFEGAIDEIFEDSIYDGVNSHCINSFYSLLVPYSQDLGFELDSQHDEYQWLGVEELTNSPDIHEIAKQKILSAYNSA
jgi:colanic acid biosynthesis protein WcaH